MLCFYGISVWASTCISALVCVSFDFYLAYFAVFILSDFIFVFVVAMTCFLIRETGRKDVGLGEWGDGRIWKELGERKQWSDILYPKKSVFMKHKIIKTTKVGKGH